MKNILCYGDSNTWGNIAGSMNPELMLAQRFEHKVRWTGALQNLLGDTFFIIEAGLNGRTTAFDEIEIARPSRNGFATLPVILEMHYPLDLVIFMLGTNDLKKEFNATPEQITQNMEKLIEYTKASHLGRNFQAPQILLVAPALIFKVNSSSFDLFYDDLSIIKSQQIAKLYKQLANKNHCKFLDAGSIVKISHVDGIHFEQSSHYNLAKVIAHEIEKMKL